MKRILLCTFGAAMTALAFSSYTNGPFAGGAGNHTGSASSVADCSTGSGCHGANTSNTSATLGVTTTSNGLVTKYVPGTTYKVTITGANTSASLPRFGFQASCVKAAATSTQAGSFTSTATNVSVRTFGTLQFVEHNTPIAALASSGNNNGYQVSFNWTAPPAGTGTVRFYSIINAVNNNGASTSDQPNAIPSFDLDEAPSTTGITSVAPAHVVVYPNPATSDINLKLNGAASSCDVRIFNLAGSMGAAQHIPVLNGAVSADVAHLAPGNYYVLAQSGGQSYGGIFTKQ